MKEGNVCYLANVGLKGTTIGYTRMFKVIISEVIIEGGKITGYRVADIYGFILFNDIIKPEYLFKNKDGLVMDFMDRCLKLQKEGL